MIFSIQLYPIRCLWLLFLLITVTWLEGCKGGDWPIIIIVNNSINKITSEGIPNFPLWVVIVKLYNLGRSWSPWESKGHRSRGFQGPRTWSHFSTMPTYLHKSIKILYSFPAENFKNVKHNFKILLDPQMYAIC